MRRRDDEVAENDRAVASALDFGRHRHRQVRDPKRDRSEAFSVGGQKAAAPTGFIVEKIAERRRP